MPHRILKYIMPLTATGDAVAGVSTGVAVFGAMNDGNLISISAAALAVMAMAVPRIIDAYRAIRVARRAEDEADTKLNSDILAREVQRRAELQYLADVNKQEILALQVQLAAIKGNVQGLKSNVNDLKENVKAITPDPDSNEFDAKK